MYVGKKVLKNPFFQNLHRDITFRTQCENESASLKIKVSKHKLNIHYRGALQHAFCLHYAPSQHIESHLGKKQLRAKITIAFLVSHLHFNNVTSHVLFYGGHLVMRRKRCTVQNQGITLKNQGRITDNGVNSSLLPSGCNMITFLPFLIQISISPLAHNKGL